MRTGGGPHRTLRGSLRGDDGAVTVEAALALCSLVAVMVLVVASVSAASAHLRCLDAAREAARLVARGEPDRAREVAAAVAPRGALVQIRVVGDQVDVEVTAAVVPGVPGLALAAGAVGVLEPGAFLPTGRYPGSAAGEASDSGLRPGGAAAEVPDDRVPVNEGVPQ